MNLTDSMTPAQIEPSLSLPEEPPFLRAPDFHLHAHLVLAALETALIHAAIVGLRS